MRLLRWCVPSLRLAWPRVNGTSESLCVAVATWPRACSMEVVYHTYTVNRSHERWISVALAVRFYCCCDASRCYCRSSSPICWREPNKLCLTVPPLAVVTLLPLALPSLVKVSDWNSFRANQIHSDSFRNLFPRQSELIRINPKKVFNLVRCNSVKN